MKFFRKDVSILIVSNGYWRSHFFCKLFSKYAHIVRIIISKQPIPTEVGFFDIIMWENDISDDIPSYIDPGKIVLFDYRDEGTRQLLNQYAKKMNLSNPKKLLILSNCEDTGCLPVPPPKLKKPQSLKPLRDRHQDIFFCCSPTYLYMDNPFKAKYVVSSKHRILYNQRLEWAEKLCRKGLLNNRQGIVRSDINYLKESVIIDLFNYYGPKIFVSPIPKNNYLTHLENTKILLCPAGHSRWTYRHIEGFFYRSLVISCDFMNFKMLPQIPKTTYIKVQDGTFRASLIEDILEDIDHHQAIADEGYEFVKHYYKLKSIYSKSGYHREGKKKIFDDFIDYFK